MADWDLVWGVFESLSHRLCAFLGSFKMSNSNYFGLGFFSFVYIVEYQMFFCLLEPHTNEVTLKLK